MNIEPAAAQPPRAPEYDQLLADLRGIIAAAQQRVVSAINQAMVETYWRVGERIVREEQHGATRAAYGEQIVARLGQELSREYGRGFSATNLRNMRKFYLTYPNHQTVSDKLTWSHYVRLMHLPDAGQRDFYGNLAIRGRWSKRELDRQIQAMLYERAARARNPQALAAGLPLAAADARPTIETVLKDPYVLDFLGLPDEYSEKDLEAAILRNIERFLLELGDDFCFLRRQRRISIDGEDYYLDLEFYHRGLRCLVLVDLKIGAFHPADIAQMQLYLEWTKRYDKREGEEDPIGLILCGTRNEQVVELLLSSQTHRLRVAQYLLLDDVSAIKRRLAELADLYDQLQPPDAESAAADSADSGC